MFWDNFYNLCVQKNVSPNYVCSKIGLSSAAATHWKSGTIPKGDVLLQLSKYLNCSVDWLLTGRAYDSSRTIDPLEDEMVKVFRQLTDTDKGQVLGFAKGIYNNYTAEIKETG